MSVPFPPAPPGETTAEPGAARGMGVLTALYYVFKPFLPLHLRYAMRRLRAHYKLRRAADWPIMARAAGRPAGWPGWPEGRRFAVVLTHDVEGPTGLARTPALAALERKIGFRSSFNFIPEGAYRVPPELRARLAADGFEVGVHDLRHDGTLYRSWAGFSTAAESINRYLKEWGAVGFRAGFMFHNLEWLRNLEIEYDASTFDTDPFEPQPDGVGTIFPFWVEGHRPGAGYVELPYTLPQDSTLFLIFRDRANDIWKRKLDWVAEQGGMALLNVHPDYVAFDRNAPGVSEFAPEFYAEFLAYVKEKYAGQYWAALPRDVARFVRELNPRPGPPAR